MASPKKSGQKTVDMFMLKLVWAIDIVLVLGIIVKGLMKGNPSNFTEIFSMTYVGALVKIVSAILLLTLIAIVHSWVTKKISKGIVLNRFVQLIGAMAIFIFAFVIGHAVVGLIL